MRRALVLLLLAGCPPTTPPGDGPGQAWTTGPEIPGKRLESGVTALGTRLVVMGGFATSLSEGLSITTDVLAFDTFDGTWTPLPAAPAQWTHINLGASGSTLFLLGGLEGTQFVARGDAYKLDDGATAWEPVAPLPEPRGAAGVVSSPPHVYLLGGASTTAALASCYDYDLLSNTWVRLPDLPQARSHPAAMRMNDGTLIVAGGLATLDATEPLSDVWALPPNGTAWQQRHAMPTARGGGAYGNIYGNLIVAGGESGRIALANVEGYDPVTDVWTLYPDLPEPRAGTQAAAIGQLLYVPGGAQMLAFEPTSSLFVFSLLDTIGR
jgi:N-acetylneuraminic acid mutarotase